MSSRDDLRALVKLAIASTGKKQYELAEDIGITAKHFSQMMTGGCGMSMDMVDRILGSCGVELIMSIKPRKEPEDDKPRDDR